MNKSSLIYLSTALAIILVIFLFVPTKKKETMQSEKSLSLSLTQFQTLFYNKQSDSVKLRINLVNEKISKAADSLAKSLAFSEAIEYYNSIECPELASLHAFQKAELVSNSSSWAICGDNFVSLLTDRKTDTGLVSGISKYATQSFEKSVSLDSNNVDAKLKLAQCYMELGGPPMEGVQLLLGVVRKDETNIRAQLLLAKFGLVSGQIEKVSQRLEKVLSLQPRNIDALLMRADVYIQSGKTALAINDLKMAKNNPDMPKAMKLQLEAAILDLEKKNK